MQRDGVTAADGQPDFLVLQIDVGRTLMRVATREEDELALLGP